ncbi:TIR domain-containing protein [Niallia circulans]|uniref:TIR domain-containing protein n=1 Tax=Niallia circulans TaxID=1397 RepID=A0A553SNJ8_NIACI|nr:toll/interleukin-1 receptor domain-containing protein [Niallia circulans]TRZ38561.1 TIR domain-containing protein [Niallia circulans]
MSITTYRNNVKRSKEKLINLRKKLVKEQDAEGKATKEVISIQKSLKTTKSSSTIKTKLTKLDRLNTTIHKARDEQRKINKNISDEEKRLLRYEEQLFKEEQRELKKSMSEINKYNHERDNYQTELFEELDRYKNAISLHTKELQENTSIEEQFDVFISHASDDKEEFVKPLAELLVESGLSVWYDEYKLTWGKSNRQTIDNGLAKCRFGIVVLSESFFKKGWTNYELNGLVTRMVTEGRDLILPIWHRVGFDEVKEYSSSLADISALRTDNLNIEEIRDILVEMLVPEFEETYIEQEEVNKLI